MGDFILGDVIKSAAATNGKMIKELLFSIRNKNYIIKREIHRYAVYMWVVTGLWILWWRIVGCVKCVWIVWWWFCAFFVLDFP